MLVLAKGFVMAGIFEVSKAGMAGIFEVSKTGMVGIVIAGMEVGRPTRRRASLVARFSNILMAVCWTLS